MPLIEKYAFRDNCCNIAFQADKWQAQITGPCIQCGKTQTVTVPAESVLEFRRGGFAQDCFPGLPAAEREFLISGFCGECWDELFPTEEEDGSSEDD